MAGGARLRRLLHHPSDNPGEPDVAIRQAEASDTGAYIAVVMDKYSASELAQKTDTTRSIPLSA
jgi:hypothetical protein